MPRLGHAQRPRVAAAALPRRRAGSSRRSSPASAKPASRSCAWSRRSTPARCWRRRTARSAPDETSEDVERDLARIGARPCCRDARSPRRRRGSRKCPRTTPTRPTRHRLAKDDGVIDWALSADQIHNQIRGLHPWPHAVHVPRRQTVDPASLDAVGRRRWQRAWNRPGRQRGSPSRRHRRRRPDPPGAPGRRQAADAGSRVPGGACRTAPGRTVSHAGMIARARVAAFDIVRAVAAGRADLPAAIARSRGILDDDRDQALAAEIATGVERWRAALDYLIEAACVTRRSIGSIRKSWPSCGSARINCSTSRACRPRPSWTMRSN